MGDSYAQGLGLRDPGVSWPTAFAQEAHATVRVDGFAGSGFTGSAYCDGEEFGTRAKALARGDDELLVIQGGLNDVTADPDLIEAAAAAVVETSGRRGCHRPARRHPSATSPHGRDGRGAGPGGRGGGRRLRVDARVGRPGLPARPATSPPSHAVFGTRVADALLEAGVLR